MANCESDASAKGALQRNACAACGAAPARLACPTCKANSVACMVLGSLSATSFSFCDKACFKSQWQVHKHAPLHLGLKFRVVCVENRGKGCIACLPIRKGEVVLEEKPVLIVDDDASLQTLDRLVESLSEASKKRFWELADAHASPGKKKTAAGVVRTNAYPVGGGKGGMFPLFARFNHSCTPNVTHSFRDGVRRVHAARDIAAGEELFNSYIDCAQPRAARQAVLQSQFQFACDCDACVSQSEESDTRRSRIRDLDDLVVALVRGDKYREAVERVQERMRLLEKEGIDSPAMMVRVAHDAVQACEYAGDRDGVAHWTDIVESYAMHIQ